jgi:hypothetical protein
MTAKPLWSLGVLVMLAGFAWGCGEDSTGPYFVDDGPYLPQTSPENVLHNWQTSYERREIEQYATLLDPQYSFKFQTPDIPEDLPRDYWNRDEDSTMVTALFDNPDVVRISLDLGAFTVEDAGRADVPGARRVRLTHATLEVELSSDTTLVAQGDILDMNFRRGAAAAGTDSTKWYIFEWQDLGGEWSAILREVGK